MNDGTLYDVFFDPSMPYGALTVLGQRRTSSSRGLCVMELGLHTGDIASGLWPARMDMLGYMGELRSVSYAVTLSRFDGLRDSCERLANASPGRDAVRIWREHCARDICGEMFTAALIGEKPLTVIEMSMTPASPRSL